jgi:predicted DNA-binding protein (MmcQ/YjbR family)
MRRVDATDLRTWCLRQAGAIEDFPFGPEHAVFKIAGKVFALSALDRSPLEVSVKCEPGRVRDQLGWALGADLDEPVERRSELSD